MSVRRLGRFLSALFTVGLVLFWITLAGWWIRSYWRGDRMQYQRTFAAPPGAAGSQIRRDYLLFSGHGGICLAIRDKQGLAGHFSTDRNWESSDDPKYPRPWGTLFTGTLILTSNTSITTGGSGVLTFSGNALTLAPSTASSLTFSSSGTLNSGSTLTFTGATSGSTGVLSVGGGTTGTSFSADKVRSGTVGTLSAVNVSGGRGFALQPMPLPAPDNPPSGPFQFLAYSAGAPSMATGGARVLILPFWSIVVPLTIVIIPMIRLQFVSIRRNKRLQQGLCTSCGYDLRASPQRCPECGAPAPQKPLAA